MPPSRRLRLTSSSVTNRLWHSHCSSLRVRSLSRGCRRLRWQFLVRRRRGVSIDGRANVEFSGNREPGRTVKAGRRPPVGEALRARSVVRHIMECEARQGFVVVPCAAGSGTRCGPSPEPACADRATRCPGCRSSLRPNCDMEWFGRNLVGSIRGSVSPQSGDHEQCRARTGLRPFRVSSRLGQATDLAVTQAVVDEDEKFAGGRHPSDLLSTALAHPLVVSANRCGAPLAGHRLDGGPGARVGIPAW